MSAFDDLKKKAADLADQAKEGLSHAKENLGGVAETVIDKAGDAVDAATGGKYADKVDAAQAKAHEALGHKGEAPSDDQDTPAGS